MMKNLNNENLLVVLKRYETLNDNMKFAAYNILFQNQLFIPISPPQFHRKSSDDVETNMNSIINEVFDCIENNYEALVLESVKHNLN